MGGDCQKQDVHRRKPGVRSVVASNWLSLGGFSLAGSVARQGENLPFRRWSSGVDVPV